METLLRCKKFDVVKRDEVSQDGSTFQREVVVHPGAVIILPVVDNATFLMLRQFRPTLGRELWELPAGTLDIPGESPEVAAARELEEEAGRRANRWTYLCEFYPSPGFCTERMVSYIAEDLEPTERRPAEGEQIMAVETLKLNVAIDMIRRGEIVDAKTIITLLRWNMQRTSPKP